MLSTISSISRPERWISRREHRGPVPEAILSTNLRFSRDELQVPVAL